MPIRSPTHRRGPLDRREVVCLPSKPCRLGQQHGVRLPVRVQGPDRHPQRIVAPTATVAPEELDPSAAKLHRLELAHRVPQDLAVERVGEADLGSASGDADRDQALGLEPDEVVRLDQRAQIRGAHGLTHRQDPEQEPELGVSRREPTRDDGAQRVRHLEVPGQMPHAAVGDQAPRLVGAEYELAEPQRVSLRRLPQARHDQAVDGPAESAVQQRVDGLALEVLERQSHGGVAAPEHLHGRRYRFAAADGEDDEEWTLGEARAEECRRGRIEVVRILDEQHVPGAAGGDDGLFDLGSELVDESDWVHGGCVCGQDVRDRGQRQRLRARVGDGARNRRSPRFELLETLEREP